MNSDPLLKWHSVYRSGLRELYSVLRSRVAYEHMHTLDRCERTPIKASEIPCVKQRQTAYARPPLLTICL